MRYFFDVREGTALLIDEEGTECTSVEDAVRQASYAVTEIGADTLPDKGGGELSVEVRDGGTGIAAVTMRLQISLRSSVERAAGSERH